jgi:Protein of unknown function (DUF1579)
MKHNLQTNFICFCLILFPFYSNSQIISEEEFKPLNFLAGEWRIEVDARLSKQGPWEKSEQQSVIKKSVGNTIFEEELSGSRQGRTFIAKSWLANDNRTKLYQKTFVDSDHGVLVLYEGKLENDLLTLLKESEINGVRLMHRMQYKFISNDTFTIETARSIDKGLTWDRTGTSTYLRKK